MDQNIIENLRKNPNELLKVYNATKLKLAEAENKLKEVELQIETLVKERLELVKTISNSEKERNALSLWV